MVMQTIYEPKGKAKEYGDLALNIYTGCPHGCVYCYAPAVLRKDKKKFHSQVESRKNIVEETKKRLAKGDIKGKEIFLCFTCDPFPVGVDDTATYRIIEAIKDSSNNVAILTKGRPCAGILAKLLNEHDRVGVTITEYMRKDQALEPNAARTVDRIDLLEKMKQIGVKTFVSFEPVYNPSLVYEYIKTMHCIDEYRIGKLNYAKSNIDWGEFGRECERLCVEHNRSYFIKAGLRQEMDK